MVDLDELAARIDYDPQTIIDCLEALQGLGSKLSSGQIELLKYLIKENLDLKARILKLENYNNFD